MVASVVDQECVHAGNRAGQGTQKSTAIGEYEIGRATDVRDWPAVDRDWYRVRHAIVLAQWLLAISRRLHRWRDLRECRITEQAQCRILEKLLQPRLYCFCACPVD